MVVNAETFPEGFTVKYEVYFFGRRGAIPGNTSNRVDKKTR